MDSDPAMLIRYIMRLPESLGMDTIFALISTNLALELPWRDPYHLDEVVRSTMSYVNQNDGDNLSCSSGPPVRRVNLLHRAYMIR